MKNNYDSSIGNIHRFLMMMTKGMLFLLLITQYSQAKKSKEEVQLQGPAEFYESTDELNDYFSRFPVITEGEPVDERSCNIKMPPPQEEVSLSVLGLPGSFSRMSGEKIRTASGVQIFIPRPAPELQTLIANVPIIFVGKASKGKEKTFRADQQKHAAMLRQILPAAGNHQLLARILANPKFRFVILYGDYSGTSAASVVSVHMTIRLRYHMVFFDQMALLRTIKNELASEHFLIENDCRRRIYKKMSEQQRVSPFLFQSATKINQNLTRETVTKEQNEVIKETLNTVADLLKNAKKFMEMSEGKQKPSKEYKELEKHLKDFIPLGGFTKMEINEFSSSGVEHIDDAFDRYYATYIVNGEKRKEINYALRSSYHKLSPTTMMFASYERDPTTIPGKFFAFFQFLEKIGQMTLGGEGSFYATKSTLGRIEELFSYLEELPQSLLADRFKKLCDYNGEYTHVKSEQDSKRGYCTY